MSDLPEWMREATEPTEIEVARLQARMRRGEDRAPERASWPVLAAVGLVLVGLLLWPRLEGYGPAPSPGAQVALGTAPLSLGPSIALTGDGSAVVLAAGKEGTRVRLLEGEVVAEVDPHGAFRALSVEAPGDVTVSVVGTRFTVAWGDDGGRVAVERGRVAVDAPELERRLLGAGESWSWDGDVAVEEESSEFPLSGDNDGAPAPPDGGDRPPGSDIQETPDDASPRRPEPSPPGGSLVDESEPVAVIDPLPRRDPGPEPVPVAPSVDDAPPVDDVARARAFGRVADASEARQWTEAAALADRFLATYPGGSLAAEAGWLRIEALSHQDAAAAVDAAAAWLAEHPSHTRRADVLHVHATMAYDRLGDCATALPSYDELTRLATGERQAKAFAFLGLCAAELGRAPLARRALDAALNHSDLPPQLAPSLRRARRQLP